MKFYDREKELESLKHFESLADKNFFFLRMIGRRRIGKTILAREYMKQTNCRSLYFFVTKKKRKTPACGICRHHYRNLRPIRRHQLQKPGRFL